MKTFIKQHYIWTSIIILVVLGLGAWIFFGSGQKSSYELTKVVKGDISQIVSVTGKVRPADSVELAFEKSGKIAYIGADIGDKVSAGQRLASLNNSDVLAQLAQAQASLDKEEVKLAELKAGTRAEELQIAQTTVANAERTLADVQSKAEVDLNNYYDDVENILNDAYVKADDAVNKQTDELFTNDSSDSPNLTFYTGSQAETNAESKRRQAGVELAAFKTEIDNLSTSQSSLDLALTKGEGHLNIILDFLNSASTAVNEAIGLSATNQTNYKYYVNAGRTNVSAALTSISTQKQYISAQKATNQSNISGAQNTLAAAQDQLALKRAGSTAEEVSAQEAQVKYAQANVQNYQAALSKTIISSPLDGIVTKRDIELGEIVAANTTVYSILSAAKFEIEANVSENEIAKVELGDSVSITLDALGSDEKFVGKIVKIDPAETIVSGVIYYKVTSVFDMEDSRIKSGMTANLDIQTEQKIGVLTLPYYLVKEKDGKKYVQIMENGGIKEQPVQTGLEGETMVEIISGLSEGQEVITNGQ
ncbi:MAG TPA: efflux RND transporter periplasmic adaptor subunit [Candidatus Portnoybacteria bacterium]|nr:efflux RND transporter periplasmic adaptor subunit [Candidatus Portnoybacteria bacterium]